MKIVGVLVVLAGWLIPVVGVTITQCAEQGPSQERDLESLTPS